MEMPTPIHQSGQNQYEPIQNRPIANTAKTTA